MYEDLLFVSIYCLRSLLWHQSSAFWLQTILKSSQASWMSTIQIFTWHYGINQVGQDLQHHQIITE